MNPRTVMLAVVLLAIPCLAKRPVDDLLNAVPDDAALVIVVSNVETFTSGLAAFGRAAGADELAELDAGDLLEEILRKHAAGVDPEGAFAVIPKPAYPGVLLLVSTTDPDAWMNQFEPSTMHDDLRMVPVREGKQAFAAVRGNVAIMADSPEVVRSALSASGAWIQRMGNHPRRMLKDNHVFLWADVQAWRPIIEPALGIGEGFLQLTTAMADPEAEANPAMGHWLFEQVRGLIREAGVYVAAGRISSDGIWASDYLDTQPGGRIAGYLGKMKRSDKDLLRGLPKQTGMLVFGCEWLAPEDRETFSEGALKAVMETPAGQEMLADPKTREGIDAAYKLYRQVSGYNGLVTRASPEGGMTMAGMYLTDRPDSVMRHLKTSFETMMHSKMMSLYTSTVDFAITHAEEDVGGAMVDRYQFRITADDHDTAQVLRHMYGESTTFYLGAHDDGVAYTMGPGAHGREWLTIMVEKTHGDSGAAARLAAGRKTIPPNPQLILLVDVPRTADFMLGMARAMGEPIPELPALTMANTPYASLGVYLERDNIKAEMYVPAAALRPVIETIKTLEAAEAPTGTPTGQP